jgi:glycosyltransferase involved in cell wall biosynthesis
LLFIGSMSRRLIELAVQYDVRDDVIFAGPVEHQELGTYLSACDVLLLPYTNRPVNLGRWPQKLGDYLSAGRPVVAGGYGDVLDFFDQHPDIGITSNDSADSFAAAILDFMSDPARVESGGKAARRTAVEQLSWLRNTHDLEDFYCELLDEKVNHGATK